MSSNKKNRAPDKGKGKFKVPNRRKDSQDENFCPFVLESYTNNVSAPQASGGRGISICTDATRTPSAVTPAQGGHFRGTSPAITPVQGSCVTDKRASKRKVLSDHADNSANKRKDNSLKDITNDNTLSGKYRPIIRQSQFLPTGPFGLRNYSNNVSPLSYVQSTGISVAPSSERRPWMMTPPINVGSTQNNISPAQGSCVTGPSRNKRMNNLNNPPAINAICRDHIPLNDITNVMTPNSGEIRNFQIAKNLDSSSVRKSHKGKNILQSSRNLDVEFSAVHLTGNSPITRDDATHSSSSVPNNPTSENVGGTSCDAITNMPKKTIPLSAIKLSENYVNPYFTKPSHPRQRNPKYPSYDDIGDPIYKCEHCSAMFWYDERIEKSRNTKAPPLFSLCCMHGKIKLPKVMVPPLSYSTLLYGKDALSRKFQKEIRFYNMIFSFTSMGGKVDNTFNTGRSAPNFRINGENHHKVGSLVPSDGKKPKFAQLYIYDTENEIKNRITMARKPEPELSAEDEEKILKKELKKHSDIVEKLKAILDEHNLYSFWFRYSGETWNADKSTDIKLRLVGGRKQDGKRYCLPQVSEVAVLIVGDVEDLRDHRDIVVTTRVGELNRVDELHAAYLPLQYPLLYVYGEDGFRDDVPHSESARSKEKNVKKVTAKEYFSFRLCERFDESPHILSGRRLLQQFIVDAYTMVESYRLTYLKFHQQELRCDSYSALGDALHSGESDPSKTGKRIILPSSFVGGARYMIQNYHDAMAICRWLGYPNLFITFTCNPTCDEIDSYVKERNLTAADRPDIVARIFHTKLDNMLSDIRQKKIFGEPSAVVYTIEFQKRGLPHAHILLFIKNLADTACANVVDGIISAEIPNPEDDEEYYDAVKEFMMHGPCGSANKNNPCMDGNRCTKHFPKRFVNRTTVDDDGFIVYRRRDDGRSVDKNGIELDNRHVVPHNAFLLKKYRSHINVEWCNRSRSIKYLFKYVHKGNDRVTAVFYQSHDKSASKEDVDEIKQYFDARYISASESCWRLFGYEIHFNYPSVTRLIFHPVDEQSIVYKTNASISDVVERSASKATMFTAWMEANRQYPDLASNLTYAEFPQQFVWDESKKVWRPRQRGIALGRLSYIYPGAGDRYYLRVLLNVVRGCKSYDDISTYNGKRYATFKEACYARGLLDDDKEFIDAIKEASHWGSEKMLRSLFVNLLTSETLTSPADVWDSCKEYLSADILNNYRDEMKRPDLTLTQDEIINRCLLKLEDLMRQKGRSLREYTTLPYPTAVDMSYAQNQMIADEMSYDRNSLAIEHKKLLNMLNDDQRAAYRSIVASLDSGAGRVFFLYGYGGTGKTFVWKTLSAAVRSKGGIVLNVASSGIASLLLPGGRTAHSKFSIPIDLTEGSTCNIKLNTDHSNLIIKTKLIIWDEAPMMHRHCFEALDRTLRDIMRTQHPDAENQPFGGKVVVLGGDFRQILPVIPKGTRQDVVHATINSSKLWDECKVLRLTKNMRLQSVGNENDYRELREFSDWMSAIGDGTLGDENDGETSVRFPDEFLITQSDNYIESMVQSTYPSFHEHIGDIQFLQGRAILAPTLEEVDGINDYMVSMHHTDERIYLSSDSIALTDRGDSMFEQMHTVEFLNTIKCSGLPNHQLRLKVGVPIMLLRNMDPYNGLCNGTRLVVTKLGNYVIQGRVLGGKNMGDLVYIPRINMTPSDPRYPFALQRRQFPIMISYAMSINKSQGQSLSNVGIFLKKPVFTHGQLYVAVSRVTNKSGLKLLLCDENGKLTNRTANVVYKEVFQNL